MEGTARIWFTPQQRAELWERWKNGQCVADIARALERRNKSGVYRILAVNGGIAPEPRRRAAGALRLEEREEISRGIAAGRSIRRIALGLRRSPSTVSREIRRNGGCQRLPRGGEADRRAWQRALRPKFLSPGSPREGATMAGRAEARTAVVAGADRRLAEAATPCRPRHADIARNDLSKSLYSDPRRAEEAADGASADGAADASSQGRQYKERTGTDRRYWSPSARNGRPRWLRTAPCQVTGKEIFSPGRTTRTSRRSSSAIPAL